MKKTLPFLFLLIILIFLFVMAQHDLVYGINENNLLHSPINKYIENQIKTSETAKLENKNIENQIKTSETAKSNASGIVYFIRAVDTETSSSPASNIKIQNITPLLLGYNKTDSNSTLSKVMNYNFRNNLTDSFNNTIKYTWFALAMEIYCVSNDTDCNIIYSALVDGIPNISDYGGWKNEIDAYGDSIEFHYHHLNWTDINNDSIYYWNQLIEFNNSNEYLIKKILNHLLIDKQFFPSSYRAGWTWEDNNLSNFLEKWIPFDFSNLAPLSDAGCGETPNDPKTEQAECEPLSNVFNWSIAPINSTFYHPNTDNYQLEGNLSRLILRCKAYYQEGDMEEVFEQALIKNQFVCLYSHIDDGLIIETQESYRLIKDAASRYNVSFKFVNADEAARIYLNSQDVISPIINIRKENSSLIVESNEEIYQEKPYVAIKYRNNTYSNLELTEGGNNRWFYNLSLMGNSEYTIGIAITDNSGNVATAKYESLLHGGDANCDGITNGLDVTYLAYYLRWGIIPPDRTCPLSTMDMDGNCIIDNSDVTYLINYFKGIGEEPRLTHC